MPFAIAAAAAAVGSAVIGSEASKDAASANTAATNKSIGVTQQASAQARGDLTPYRTVGASALQRLAYLSGASTPGQGSAPGAYTLDNFLSYNSKLGTKDYGLDAQTADAQQQYQRYLAGGYGDDAAVSKQFGFEPVAASSAPGGAGTANPGDFGSLTKAFTPSDLTTDPSYLFRLSQGNTALTRAMAAKGEGSSSPGLKSLIRYNQDYASTEYQAAFNRDQTQKQSTYGILASMAGMGQNSAAMSATTALNAAGTVGAATMAGGAATAAGITGSASAVNNSIQGGLSNYMYQNRYDQLMQTLRTPTFSQPTSNFEYTGTTAAGGNQYG